jgi:hypothetical protein
MSIVKPGRHAAVTLALWLAWLTLSGLGSAASSIFVAVLMLPLMTLFESFFQVLILSRYVGRSWGWILVTALGFSIGFYMWGSIGSFSAAYRGPYFVLDQNSFHYALNVTRWMLLGLSVGVARSLWLRWPAAATIMLIVAYGIDQSISFWPLSTDLLNRIARSVSSLVHRDFSGYFLRGVFENLVSGLVIVYMLRRRSERAVQSGSQTATA